MNPYTPGQPPNSLPHGLVMYLYAELQKISLSLQSIHDFSVLHKEPDRLSEGMLRYADGTDWQASPGLYVYDGTTWTKL